MALNKRDIGVLSYRAVALALSDAVAVANYRKEEDDVIFWNALQALIEVRYLGITELDEQGVEVYGKVLSELFPDRFDGF